MQSVLMVATPVRFAFWGFIMTVIGIGIGSTFMPHRSDQRDFTIKSSDKRYVQSLPKDKYMNAIKTVVDSDKPFFGSKRSKD